MKAQCKKCGQWFKITRQLNELIEEGIIHPLDINLCPECAEIAAEMAEYEEENSYILNECEL